MNNFKFVSALLRATWLVDNEWAEQNLSLAQSILEGNTIASENIDRNVVSLDSRFTKYHYRDGWSKASKGSFAFHNITGPLIHYGWCDDGTHELHQSFKEAENTPNISGHFFFMDTPGGQADGIKEFAETIKNSTKPVVAFVNGGMIASGGVWIASAADEIFCSSELCYVGSIGAYSTLIDTTERDQRDGVKRIVIKARQSKDKNTVYELAKSGDEKALAELKDDVSVLAQHFIDSVSQNRSEKLTTQEWNTGKMYHAGKAVEMGLVDGILSFESTVNRLEQLSKTNKKSKTNMKNFNNVAALAGMDQVSQEAMDLANADLTAAGITHVTLVEQSVLDEASRVTSELATANTTVAQNATKIQELESTVSANKVKIETLEGVIANRASVDGGVSTAGDATKKAEIKTEEKEVKYSHNKVADNSFFGV